MLWRLPDKISHRVRRLSPERHPRPYAKIHNPDHRDGSVSRLKHDVSLKDEEPVAQRPVAGNAQYAVKIGDEKLAVDACNRH